MARHPDGDRCTDGLQWNRRRAGGQRTEVHLQEGCPPRLRWLHELHGLHNVRSAVCDRTE